MIDQDKAMKFRNPKTGNVYDGMEDTPCDEGGDCDNCKYKPYVGDSCTKFCREHPVEAARRMGYEIIEEEPMEQTDKPRICEVLGVEVGERFNIAGCSDFDSCDYDQNQKFFIDSTGTLLEEMKAGCDSPASIADGRVVCLVWNHPDRIIRKPRFTAAEVADAKTIKRMFSDEWDAVIRYPDSSLALDDSDGFTLALAKDMFPSIRPGQAVQLEDILENADEKI